MIIIEEKKDICWEKKDISNKKQFREFWDARCVDKSEQIWGKYLTNEEKDELSELYDKAFDLNTDDEEQGELFRKSVHILSNAFPRQLKENGDCEEIENVEFDDDDFSGDCGIGFFGATIVTCKTK